MNIGETYRVYATHSPGQYADVLIKDVMDDKVTIKRLKDGEIVEVERDWFEQMWKKRLDESTAYGIDCPSGKCEW